MCPNHYLRLGQPRCATELRREQRAERGAAELSAVRVVESRAAQLSVDERLYGWHTWISPYLWPVYRRKFVDVNLLSVYRLNTGGGAASQIRDVCASNPFTCSA